MISYARLLCVLFACAATAGCFNLATSSSQIAPAYTSDLKYDQHPCDRLAIELSSLSRREVQLAIAQEQRRSSSMVQAFWLGFGQGDGIEASELSNVRGEKEAVRKAMEIKRCESSVSNSQIR